MRFLLLDAGNSALKWATTSDDGTLGLVTQLDYPKCEDTIDACSLGDMLTDTLRTATPAADRTLGCIVAGNKVRSVIDAVFMQQLDTAPTWLDAQASFDDGRVHLTSAYREPEQLGSDRWHAMLGARAQSASALVVVQAGTATTLDAIDRTGRFVGGEILPGWQMMLAGLARGTGRLPFAQGHATAFADNTMDAIASGVADAQVGAVERFVRRSVHVHGATQVLLTGGGAHALYAALRAAPIGSAPFPPLSIQDNLVLHGLALRASALT